MHRLAADLRVPRRDRPHAPSSTRSPARAQPVSIAGVWLNIRRHVACFYLWAATNATWAYADATHGLPAQAVVQTIYFGLSIYGIVSWSRKDRQDQQDQQENDK